MKKQEEQILFELIEEIDETLDGDLHIIDQTERFPEAIGEREFRVYHKNGYCFDVSKKANDIDDETGEVKEWYYDFFAEWEGFDKITMNKAIDLIKNHNGKRNRTQRKSTKKI